MPDLKYQICTLLHRDHKGRDRAILVRDLSVYFRCPEREIRETLRLLNMEGYPIVTSTSIPMGVYWAATEQEVDEYLANLKARATSIFKRMAAIDKIKTKEFLKGQMELFG
jgi:hypothetical protein